MDVKISMIPESEAELVDIRCHEETDSVREIAAFVRSRQGQLSGAQDGRQYNIPVSEIMYIESVDNRTFILIFKLKVYKKSSKISNKWILRRFFVYTLIKNQYYLYFAKGLWIQTANL